MPISSNVFGPLPPDAVEVGVEGLEGGAGPGGLPACAGSGFLAGGCCCCCIVATLWGLGMPSCPEGRPAELGLEDTRGGPCPGTVVDGRMSGREEVLLS
jgi:hypothetical protein